jgi:hypothetical protein
MNIGDPIRTHEIKPATVPIPQEEPTRRREPARPSRKEPARPEKTPVKEPSKR